MDKGTHWNNRPFQFKTYDYKSTVCTVKLSAVNWSNNSNWKGLIEAQSHEPELNFSHHKNRHQQSQKQMGLVSTESIWSDRITLALACINNLILLIILSKQLYHQSSEKTLNTHIKIMHTFALLTISIYVLYCAIRVPVSFAIIPSNIMNCSIQSLIMVIIAISAKALLYLFCTTRYFETTFNSI